MGAGSSAEPEPEPEPAEILDANVPVSGTGEEDLAPDAPRQEPCPAEGAGTHQESHGEQPEGASSPQEPPGPQGGADAPAVGQTEQSSANLQEEAVTMETSPSDSSTKDGLDDGKEDPHISKKLPSSEEDAEDLDQASEPQSYDLGFKKVFKFVGFRFTVKKEKTGKSEPVQLLTVKKEMEGTEGAGDQSEASPEETPVPEDTLSAQDDTKDATKDENPEDESPKTSEAKELSSQSAALATDTTSPLRKFFSQGWTGFRKKKSFRKPKEDELQSSKKEEDQEKEEAPLTAEATEKEEKSEDQSQDQEKIVTAVTVETHEKEQTEDEKQESEKTMAAIVVEASKKEELTRYDRQGHSEVTEPAVVKVNGEEVKTEGQENKLVESSEEVNEGEKGNEVTVTACTTEPIVSALTESASGELKASQVVTVEGKRESVETCEINDKTEKSSGEKLEVDSLLAVESSGEELKKSEERAENKPESLAPLKEETVEKTQKPEPVISPATEDLNGKGQTLGEAHDTAMEMKADKAKTCSTSEHSFDMEDDQQPAKPIDEGLQGQTGIVTADDTKPTDVTTEVTPDETAERRPPEGITSEAELLSSQEKTKLQGSPLKKLFTGTGLKKLSGKKHKGRREESKLGEQGEQTQHLSDSPDSPEEQKAESSASSPEELHEIPSLEKPADGMQVTENEDAAISDMERKRESVTPWASFKKMVTPKKRVRRPSESDKEEEIDKTKSASLSTTENAVDENQRELKENGVDQKQEKVIEEPKRKVDTSVSWEAFICVGSSKKRARKSSSSDEETEHKPGQEGPKTEESGQSKEAATDTVLTSSQESDQGQGNSSPEQAGSPSEGEGISTWESFKRLVTPRRKSKTRMEDRTEETVVGSSLEHSTSDGEPGKDESWVPFRKLMPGRRKKKSDGKPEPTLLKQAREDMAETTEEDSDVPAVVPLSEYEAAEQEKLEAQKAKDAEAKREQTLEKERAEKLEETVKTEQASEGLVHAVSVTVVEGERAVTSIEERSPSWISAAVMESIEQAEEEEEKETKQTFESEAVVEEAAVDAKTVPEVGRDTGDDTTASEPELTSEAVTALEETTEAYCAEETMEVSFAEETTEMVSAVSRLSETPDTTEEVTPVQEVEATEQNLRELARQTQEVLQEVAERVRSSDVAQLVSETTMEATVTKTVQEIESEMKDGAKDVKVLDQEFLMLEQSLKTGGHKEDDIQALGSARSTQAKDGDEGVLHEGLERGEIPAAMKASTERLENVDVLRDESQGQMHEEAVVDDHEEAVVNDHEEAPELQKTAEKPSSEDKDVHSSKVDTSKEEPLLKQESSEQDKLPLPELTRDEMRDEHTPGVETAVQNMDAGDASALGPAGTASEVPVQLEGEGDISSKSLEDTEAVVVAVPGTPVGEETTPALGSPGQTWTKGVPGEAPPQGEESRSGLPAVQAAHVPAAELPRQREIQVSALPPETTGSEAAAVSGQSVSEQTGEQISAEDSGPSLKPKCLERATEEVLCQSHEAECGQLQDAELKTSALSQSENTKEDKMEGATLSMDSCGPVTAAPTHLEGEAPSALPLTGMEATDKGSRVLSGSSPKICETPSSVAAEEPVEAEELLDTSSCEDVLREETKGEQLVGTSHGVGDSDTLEAVNDDGCYSCTVQQGALAGPEEGPGLACPGAESLEPPQVSVAASAPAPGEPVPAEAMTLTAPTAETLEPLATSPGQVTAEEVPAATVDHLSPEIAELDSTEAPHPQAPPVSLKAIPEQKQEMPQGFEHPEASVAASKKSPSFDCPQLEKDVVQSVALESQSTEIVLNAIQTAVDRLAETKESAASEPEQHTKSTDKSQTDSSTPEFLETVQGNHLPVDEEEIPIRDQEQSRRVKHSPLGESAEIHISVEQAKDKLLISHAPQEGKSENSLEVTISPQDDSRESPRLPNSTVGIGTSKDTTKEPIDTHPPKLKEKEVGQILEIPDQNTVQQTQAEKKDEQHNLSVEDVKTLIPEPEDVCSHEGAACHHPQSLNSVAPEASNMC